MKEPIDSGFVKTCDEHVNKQGNGCSNKAHPYFKGKAIHAPDIHFANDYSQNKNLNWFFTLKSWIAVSNPYIHFEAWSH